MDRKKLPAIVGIAAVIIFFIWGFIEGTYSHAWIIFLVAGLVDVIIAGMNKKPEDKADVPAAEPEAPAAEPESKPEDAE